MLFKQTNKIFFPDVSKGITRSTLLYISKVKSVLPLNMPRIWTKNYLVSVVASHLVYYPTPISLTYAWSFGSLAGVTLVVPMVSGIFLSMYYIASIDLAFSSIEYINIKKC